MIFSVIVSFLALVGSAASTPIIKPQELIVIRPHITSPTEAVKWAPGSVQNITWETDQIPPNLMNSHGSMLLGYITRYTDDDGVRRTNENLNLSVPLATNFTIGKGWHTITVPDVPPRDSYIVALLGDSGNISPQFKIRA
ncbi:unnamed protein product [Mycena citricolor]|uniref:Ser-Thr-rich glycosyl-phosphatidyl-inositol-anchored membrane family-domain-containing protein n=1 Tax=Mycena citricolor TaxID=2018698 RepID=A0AAD2HXP8_9AGAR|nr:unnamed protein product [Mycena citricolor]